MELCSYDGYLPLLKTDIAERLSDVEARIESALSRSERSRSSLTLVAVTKKFSAAVLAEAYRSGMTDFGENYVQEFAGKRNELPEMPKACFHLIGHLQSNKARQAVELFDIVHTVDTPKLLNRLNMAALECGRQVRALIEVKLSDEPTKNGALPEQVTGILDSATKLREIQIIGLMTIPPWSTESELSRPYFRELAALGRRYGLAELSMGMSNDFEVAIEEGSTFIRVGTALFGRRPKPEAVADPPPPDADL